MEVWKMRIFGGIGAISVGIILIAIFIDLLYYPVISANMRIDRNVEWYLQPIPFIFGIMGICAGITIIHKARQIKVKLENVKKR